eukprot:5582998-Pyramimonas_sp.AAC.1
MLDMLRSCWERIHAPTAMGRPPGRDDPEPDGPEEEFREAVVAGATRWIPGLSEPDGGEST